jgi:glyoxylase-like metal-dependent hydrolase (beta-lactamase superfamily II)
MRCATRYVSFAILVITAAIPLCADVTSVARDVWLIRGAFVAGRQPDGNTTLIQSDRGLIVIDTGRHAAHTEAVLKFARSLDRPIIAIINTHWHLDHIGGNALIRQQFPAVRVYATSALAEARQGFLRTYRVQLETALATITDPERATTLRTELELVDSADKLMPDIVLDRSGAITIDGRDVIVNVETDSVTRRDIWIFDAISRVLIAGDLVTLPAPLFDTASPKNWRKALESLGRARFKTIIPGHGPPLTRPQFTMWQRAFGRFLDCADSSTLPAPCSDQWVSDVRRLLSPLDQELSISLMKYYFGLLKSRHDQPNPD